MNEQEIKNSLNIPKTNFEMRANLAQKEPRFQQEWVDQKIYQKVLSRNKGNEQYVLHDGPPYANGNIHTGHALNKIIKDIIVRYANMTGKYSPFVLGWDTHGLPIEHAITKKMSSAKYNQLDNVTKRRLCHEFAQKNILNQQEQFKKLGLFTDWDTFYATFQPDFEHRQLELFNAFLSKGLVYQDRKPVYWSWSSQTALAETEIEYAQFSCDSLYFSFDVKDGKGVLQSGDQLVIWTTTPWTIPANLAVAVHPQQVYSRITCGDKFYVIAQSRLDDVAKKLNLKDYKVVKNIVGKQLENIVYQHCFYPKRLSPIILAEYVTMTDGTGLVHNAPDFGNDDYLACKKYQIKPYCPIDQYGKYNAEINDEQLVNMFYLDACPIIVQRLKDNGHCLKHETFQHSAAVDWRTKKPVIYRATKQWFVNITPLKKNIIRYLDNVEFNNQSHKKHMIEMINNRYEWCISRQRIWGVPIIVIYDQNDEPIFDNRLQENILRIIHKETTRVWFEKPAEYFLTPKYLKTGHKYHKCLDTMDVWFDSGSSHLLANKYQWKMPLSLYLEGNDQYRGWFNSSLITCCVTHKYAPYQKLISHGMVVDEQGRKMSKSLGNGIDPLTIVQKNGADVLRLWAAYSDFTNDVSIGKNIIDQVVEIYRRLRNSLFRFCLANTSDFDWGKHHTDHFDEINNFVLNKLEQNIQSINGFYEKQNFNMIIKTVNTHLIDLSSWYFDYIKDSLYCDEVDHPYRREIQTVLACLLRTYVVLLTPILPHTCHEVHHFLPDSFKNETNIMLEKWVNDLSSFCAIRPYDQKRWDLIFKLRDLILVEIEIWRNKKIINKSNEVEVTVSFTDPSQDLANILQKILNVANVKIVHGEQLKIQLEKTTYVRCPRCWKYYPQDQIHDGFCPRCTAILKKR